MTTLDENAETWSDASARTKVVSVSSAMTTERDADALTAGYYAWKALELDIATGGLPGDAIARHRPRIEAALRAQGDSASTLDGYAQAIHNAMRLVRVECSGTHMMGYATCQALARILGQRDSATTEGAVLAAVLRREWDRKAGQFLWASDPGPRPENAWADAEAEAIVAALNGRALLADVPDEADSGLDEFGNPAGYAASGTGAGESQS